MGEEVGTLLPFKGTTQKLHKSLPFVSHWTGFNHMTILTCKGNWDCVFCCEWLGEGISKDKWFLPQLLNCLGNSYLHLSRSFFICKPLHSFTHGFILHTLAYVRGLCYKVLVLNHLIVNGSSYQLDHKPHEVSGEVLSCSLLYPSIPCPLHQCRVWHREAILLAAHEWRIGGNSGFCIWWRHFSLLRV